MKTKTSKEIKNLVAAAVCLALCMVLPLLTGQVPQVGARLAPMHIPVLLCGFIAGPVFAAAVGLIAPLLRFSIFGMPPLMPTAVAMTFELAMYGLAAGFLYMMLPKKIPFVYVSLIVAMLAGRVVWGIARWVIGIVIGPPFSLQMFMAGAFINAVPGIILHIVLIPIIVMALRKAKLLAE